MSSQYEYTSSSQRNRNNSTREIEEKSRKRKQDEIFQLRDALSSIPTGDYNHFLGRTGQPPHYSQGLLVQWQVISMGAQAIR
jgi:hypothetical protein